MLLDLNNLGDEDSDEDIISLPVEDIPLEEISSELDRQSSVIRRAIRNVLRRRYNREKRKIGKKIRRKGRKAAKFAGRRMNHARKRTPGQVQLLKTKDPRIQHTIPVIMTPVTMEIGYCDTFRSFQFLYSKSKFIHCLH